jgi:glucose-1-phosphate thymidylyltransferase
MPVFDKPMIYYPISTLMLAGIREILIITTPHDQGAFQKLLGDGNQWGMRFEYAVQEQPNGLAEAFLIGEQFINGAPVALILGDNLFHGAGMGLTLQSVTSEDGATVFAQRVSNPGDFGVVEFDNNGIAISIEEKPAKPKSQYAIPGLYFYDSKVCELAAQLSPSARGELEISDINRKYLDLGQLSVRKLNRGTAWLDTGSFDSLQDAAEYVRIVERRQTTKIGVPEEVAWRQGFITDTELRSQAARFMKSGYGEYLIRLLDT